jgi:hypothetical protein
MVINCASLTGDCLAKADKIGWAETGNTALEIEVSGPEKIVGDLDKAGDPFHLDFFRSEKATI